MKLKLGIMICILGWIVLVAVAVHHTTRQPVTHWRAITDQEWNMVLEHREDAK